MIKTKIISLIAASTIVGGVTGAGIVSSLNQNTNTAVTTINSQAQKLDETTVGMNKATEKITTLEISVKTTQGEVNRLKIENKDLKEKVTNMQSQIDTLEKQADISKTENGDLTGKVKELEAKKAELEKTIASNIATIEAKNHEIEGLQYFLADTRIKWQDELNKREANDAIIADLQKQLGGSHQELVSEKESHSIDNANHSKDLTDINNAVNNQKEQIDKASKTANASNEAAGTSLENLNKALNN